ncbi:MAG: GAF domain-containing protein [Elusimicrobia bacterium]|nr:GAF domain-containing protein [Elusimicrobiota bacterium]
MPELVVLSSGREVARRPVPDAGCSIGRSVENEVMIDDPRVSRRHGLLKPEAGGFVYEDAGSTHGSFVGDQKVTRLPLKDGTVVRLGSHELVFLLRPGSPIPPPPSETPVTSVGPKWNEFATIFARPSGGDEGAKRLKALFEITRTLETGTDFGLVLKEILDRAVAIMGAERGFIMLREADGSLRVHVARDGEGDIAVGDQDTVSKSLMQKVAEKGEPVLIRNAMNLDEGGTHSMLINRIHTAICVPLSAREQTTGVLYVDHRSRKNGFDDQDLAFLATFAVQAQAAIEWSRAYWELVESLFEASEDVILVVSQDGTVRQGNNGAAKLLGLERGALAGKALSSLVAPEDLGAVKTLLDDTLSAGVATGRDLSLRLPDGRALPLNVSTFSLKDRRGGTAGLCLIGRDVRDLKALVSMLSEANLELKAVNTRKEQFVGMVTHEFKSPLAVVMGYADMLLKPEEMAAERRQEFMGKIMTASQRMLAMCTELLELMKVETGQAQLALEDVDVNALVKEVADYVAVRAKEKRVTMHLELPSEPLSVKADRNLLWRVLDNFMGNGIKYNKDGGNLWVRVKADGSFAEFEFKDEGIGMSPDDQKRLFGQFFRAANARKIAGTGLGLSIVKSIVDRHGGAIEFTSALNQGSRFVVRWPILSAPEAG